ncbi:MAG TPA: zf-HC2 domain-containing protein [Chthonomonadales bacterium]|nr:zf-HC2 domain-containing protein [Chthonomonadales bacterium]
MTNEASIEPGADRERHRVRFDLKAYLDGELAAPRALLVRCHLAYCGECKEELVWLKRLGEDMRDLDRATPPPELRDRIMNSLPARPAGLVRQPVRSARLRPRLAHWYAASMAVCAAGGAFALLRMTGPGPLHSGKAHESATSPSHPETALAAAAQPGRSAAGLAGSAQPAQTGAAVSLSGTAQPDQESSLLPHESVDYNRLARQIMLRREQREARQRLAAAQQAPRLVLVRPTEVALSVADPASAVATLKSWAAAIGGKSAAPRVTPKPLRAIRATSRPVSGSPASITHPGDPALLQPDHIVTLIVPAAQQPALMAILRGLRAPENAVQAGGRQAANSTSPTASPSVSVPAGALAYRIHISSAR